MIVFNLRFPFLKRFVVFNKFDKKKEEKFDEKFFFIIEKL
jgi:hypothetical protein